MKQSALTSTNQEQGFLFNVDIMIHSSTNALALQTLLEMLNEQEQVIDFRIQSGMELGTIINEVLQKHYATKQPHSRSTPIRNNTEIMNKKPVQDPSKPSNSYINNSDDWIHSAMQANKLIRIHIRDNKGAQKSIPCRILNYDHETKLVSIYHVDEKQVYSFHTSEIETYV